MNLKNEINAAFDEYVHENYADNADMRHAIKSHPRRQRFLENLETEFRKVRIMNIGKGKKFYKPETIRWAVKQMMGFFVSSMELEANERVASDAEKARVKSEAEDMRDIDRTLEGKPSGDYADIVQVVGDGDAELKTQNKA